MINFVKKVWGNEEWLINNNQYCAKYLNLNKGYECSVHYHVLKNETFYIVGGEVELFYINLAVLENKDLFKFLPLNQSEGELTILENRMTKILLLHGEQFRLQPFVAHKFRAHTESAKILEVSTTHYDTDSYRLTQARQIPKV